MDPQQQAQFNADELVDQIDQFVRKQFGSAEPLSTAEIMATYAAVFNLIYIDGGRDKLHARIPNLLDTLNTQMKEQIHNILAAPQEAEKDLVQKILAANERALTVLDKAFAYDARAPMLHDSIIVKARASIQRIVLDDELIKKYIAEHHISFKNQPERIPDPVNK